VVQLFRVGHRLNCQTFSLTTSEPGKRNTVEKDIKFIIVLCHGGRRTSLYESIFKVIDGWKYQGGFLSGFSSNTWHAIPECVNINFEGRGRDLKPTARHP
jgi:hypothetical protein